ncbi:hypothetical protein NPX13_g4129 [Xylaria arbuscula]|uniref:NACHT domain-containing protein n=1 Tax=Xylaria arbuscula TaxID=114810 RepID=A0A9W8NGF5_9PEZI|nr:hypothetical protein NPX13_g4129 [Xylaria arbuscula]
MEGFAALGVAVNIAQVLEYGFKLVQKSRNLRDVGVLDPDLDSEARRIQALAASLDSQVISRNHEDLRSLARQGVEVSTKLIEELESLKVTDPKSKRQRAVAVWRSERRKKHIHELENRLRNCETQLGLYLTNLSRTESNAKLDNIGLDSGKILNGLADLQSTAKRLTDVGQGVSSSIQLLVTTYHNQLGEQLILDKLHFPDMHERFDTIPKAHEETFKWLFKSDDSGDDIKAQASKAFISWLQQGSGFFHISGKVGAGKSTMMKYICSHDDLDAHLKVWCDGTQLGRGQFFFWKPGTVAQKSLKGLLRGLLHSILEQSPNLISTALPVFWKLITAHPTSSRELEYRDFEEGFTNILKYASTSRLYKFALFIDGLDEFEGQPLNLIKTMKAWTEQYPSILKICVSSREYSVFQVSFSPYPKLRLHEYTSTDIARMASTQLQSISQHANSSMSDQTVQTLAGLIRNRAEGVFLWVSMVLANIEDAVMSGASLYELKAKIAAYPMELEPLYWHLVHLIHQTDRKWAFSALKMVQFFQCSRSNVRYRPHWGLSLLELSFLDDTQHCDEFEPGTINENLQNTYRKVYGRCKGFLHVRNRDRVYDDIEANYGILPAPLEQEVVLIHRSIVEFLETPDFTRTSAEYISGFDCFDNASRCPGVIIDWCLRHGADPDQAIGKLIPGGPRSLSSLSPNDGWEMVYFTMAFGPTQAFPFSWWLSTEMLLLMNETSCLYQGIKENRGVVKFRDVLKLWYPNNRYFPNLIDGLHRSSRDEEAFGSEALPSVADIPLGAIHGQHCEEEYQEYFEKDVKRILEGAGVAYPPFKAIDNVARFYLEEFNSDGSA